VTAKVISFGTLNASLAKDQTKIVMDRLQAMSPRHAYQMQVVPSPLTDEERENEPFLAASAEEVTYLEDQLLAGEFRLVVLQAPDLVLPLREGVVYAAVPTRDTPFDALLSRRGAIIDDLEDGAKVGVLSLRSKLQVQDLWPHLDVRLRPGGVMSSLEALLRRSEIDALVAPAAVAEHLGLQSIVTEIFNPDLILPGGGQGILVVLGLAEDLEVREILAPLHSEATFREMEAEHAFLQRFASDQDLPLSVLARCTGARLAVTGAVGSSQGASVVRANKEGPAGDAAELGGRLAESLLLSDATVISLLEADFPEGVPDDDILEEETITGELEADVLAELDRLEELAALTDEEDDEDDEDDDDRD
jgi:hydroxymethylbilane synthase